LLTQLEEDRRRQAEDRQRSDSIIMKLAHDLEDTRRSALAIEMKVNSLLPAPKEAKFEVLQEPAPPVRAWKPPTPKPNPLDGVGVFKRVWIHLVHPEKLRRGWS
jgi:hypothetical protein